MLILTKREGPVYFDVVADPIIRVVPQRDGATVCTLSGGREYVIEMAPTVVEKLTEELNSLTEEVEEVDLCGCEVCHEPRPH